MFCNAAGFYIKLLTAAASQEKMSKVKKTNILIFAFKEKHAVLGFVYMWCCPLEATMHLSLVFLFKMFFHRYFNFNIHALCAVGKTAQVLQHIKLSFFKDAARDVTKGTGTSPRLSIKFTIHLLFDCFFFPSYMPK